MDADLDQELAGEPVLEELRSIAAQLRMTLQAERSLTASAKTVHSPEFNATSFRVVAKEEAGTEVGERGDTLAKAARALLYRLRIYRLENDVHRRVASSRAWGRLRGGAPLPVLRGGDLEGYLASFLAEARGQKVGLKKQEIPFSILIGEPAAWVCVVSVPGETIAEAWPPCEALARAIEEGG